jgi:hypothetical protein
MPFILSPSRGHQKDFAAARHMVMYRSERVVNGAQDADKRRNAAGWQQ